MTSEVRIGFCPQADSTCGDDIPILSSLNFAHASPCIAGRLVCCSFSSEFVDTRLSKDPAHPLRHKHVVAITKRTRARLMVASRVRAFASWLRANSRRANSRIANSAHLLTASFTCCVLCHLGCGLSM